MDKNAIKKYAVWARNELISRVTQKALQYGVSATECGNERDDSVNGRILSSEEKAQRASLIARVKSDGFEQAVEEAAYTWFNRFIALRYMEVNGYLPSHIRVFTNEQNEFKPEIIDEAIHLDIDGLDIDKVYAFKTANNTDELYKYLLITQCHALGEILPEMFTTISDHTQLLFPDNLLREGSVIGQMIAMIPEEDWKDQVQIIGWLYQYYNTEPKDKVFADLKKNIKISKENIPAATQLFTPDWIVRYMVENSLGRLWLDGHSDCSVKSEWKYYLEEAEQEESVKAQLEEIRRERSELNPEQIKFIDPCMGSGHILVYAFDVLMQIYTSCGYSERDAAQLIIKKNLYGLDIDRRAYQLAYFALMMKAKQYDRRFLTRRIKPNLAHFQGLESVCDANVSGALKEFAEQFRNCDTYGSLTEMNEVKGLDEALDDFSGVIGMEFDKTERMMTIYKILSQKYDVVCTNPPYMGGSGMNDDLSKFVKNDYPDSKSDLFSCFIERAYNLAKSTGFTSLITMESWMFLSSFEKLRKKINISKTIINMVHMPYLGKGGTSLGINFGTAAVVMKNSRIANYNAQYEYTVYYETDDNGVPYEFPTKNERWKTAKQENFSKIPGAPVAYWVSEKAMSAFDYDKLGNNVNAVKGLDTCDNDRFVRHWSEVNIEQISFSTNTSEQTYNVKWYPYCKGGGYSKWYGFMEKVVDWENDGSLLRNLRDENGKIKSRPQNIRYYFKEGLTWSTITSYKLSLRYMNHCIFGGGGSAMFMSDNMYYYLAYINSKVTEYYLSLMNPTLNFLVSDILGLPIINNDTKLNTVEKLSKENVSLSRSDWDSFETSWDFKKHPLISVIAQNRMYFDDISRISLAECFECWQLECEERFNTLKRNEEELNRIFIDIYGLQDELTPEVEDKDVTVRKADLQREIKSLISYVVGCMFGRYSLDVEGLAYAGGEWDPEKYKTFAADSDNIIPICDDEYFDDDITGRFVEFIKTVFGESTLEENLRFIANALGGKGMPREVIRNYFLNDFYADHCRIYQKRPIYWLFDSGKKNGFKALIYMHRYQPDTIARIRTDYVHEQQSRYRTVAADLERRIEGASASERVKLNKALAKVNDQAEEIRSYEEKIHHLADQMIKIDLDDGVKNNYEIFKDVLAKIK